MARELSVDERRLLVSLAATRAVREARRDEIRALAGRIDASAVQRHMEQHRLLPLLGTRVLDLVPDAGAAWEAPVRAAVRGAQLRGMLFEAVEHEAVSALEGAGICVLAMKGSALARIAHGDAGMRIAGDVDLLVPTADVLHALAVLRRLGYEPPTDRAWVGGLPLLHFTLDRPDDATPRIELHWRMHYYERGFSQELLAQSHREHAMRRPERALELASLLLFHARDGFLGLRLVADIAAWWDRYGEAVPYGALEPIMQRHPQLARSLVASAHAVEAVAGVPAAALVGARGLDPPGSIAVRLADPFADRGYRPTVATLLLIDWLLAPGHHKLGVLRRNVVQPLAHIRDEHGLEDARAEAVVLRAAGHAAGTTARYLPGILAQLWRVRGQRWLSLPAAMRVSSPAAS